LATCGSACVASRSRGGDDDGSATAGDDAILSVVASDCDDGAEELGRRCSGGDDDCDCDRTSPRPDRPRRGYDCDSDSPTSNDDDVSATSAPSANKQAHTGPPLHHPHRLGRCCRLAASSTCNQRDAGATRQPLHHNYQYDS